MRCTSTHPVRPVDLLFNIIYKKNVTSIEISKWETVGRLKAAIQKRLGVEAKYQKLENWFRVPYSDSSVLAHLCSENGIAYLNLSSEETSTNIENDSFKRAKKVNSREKSKCCLNLVEYLKNNYNYTGFHYCSLKEALDQSCFAPKENRKILLLYFHNKSSEFSQSFCLSLSNPEIQEIITRRFFLLGWDVENCELHNVTKELKEFTELSDLVNLLKTKISTVLLIMPINQSISVFTCIQGNVEEKDILDGLVKAEECFLEEIEFECELEEIPKNENFKNDIDSAKFQQLMCDLLADRDYDSFEHDQHELLKNKIGYAFFGPPNTETGYDPKQTKKIGKIYDIILQENNKIAKCKDRVVISFIYNCTEPLPKEKISQSKKYCDYNPKTDLTPAPIFVLRKCKKSSNACRIFIDNLGCVYQAWSDYISSNNLPRCQMVLPLNGRYQTGKDGKVLLETYLSPACGIDLKTIPLSSAAGLVSGGILIAAAIPSVSIAPVAFAAAGVGIGMYSMKRGFSGLCKKKQEQSSFSDCETKRAYSNLLEALLSFSESGTDANLVQLSASMLFFRNLVYDSKTSKSIIKEQFSYNKILNIPVTQKGAKEAVSVIRYIKNKEETFATLMKCSKLFSDNRVTFTVYNSDIFLNGIKIDVNIFETPKSEVTLLTKIQLNGQVDINEIPGILNRFRLVCGNNTQLLIPVVNYTLQLFLNSHKEIRNKIINVFVAFMIKLAKKPDFLKKLDQLFPNHVKFLRLIDMIVNFFDQLVSELECQYQKHISNESESKEPMFALFSMNFTERLVEIFKYVTIAYLIDDQLTEGGIKEIFDYFYSWFAKQICVCHENAERKEKRKKHCKKIVKSVNCKVCMGSYFI